MLSQESSFWVNFFCNHLFLLPSVAFCFLQREWKQKHPRNHAVVFTLTSANEVLPDWLFTSAELTPLLGGLYWLKIPRRSNVKLLFDLFIKPNSMKSKSTERFQQELSCSELTEWLAWLQYLVLITALSNFNILCAETAAINNCIVRHFYLFHTAVSHP